MADERNLRLDLEYDGTNYAGFQYQPNLPTIQGAVEDVLTQVTGAPVRVHGAGRTDAGVHALGQVVSFRTRSSLPVSSIVNALNARLPKDIVVLRGEEVGPDFHARYSARGRLYRYVIWNGATPKAIGRQYLYYWRGHLDDRLMSRACNFLVGTHDFASFAGAADPEKPAGTTEREVFRCACWREGDQVLVEVAANAFLPHMVRNIVGTLIWVGSGRIAPDDVPRILAARDRRCAGPTAPARGLFLVAVWY